LPKNNREVVAATNNPGKILEIREILKDLPYQVLPISALDENFSVEEDGLTYAENAIKKAWYAASCTAKLAIADDSGLEVDALGGAPGMYSARFGGPHLSQTEKNVLLLQKLAGSADRSARFRCVIAVVSPQGEVETMEGICEGRIGTEERGTFGFGFDPIFIVPEYQSTMAELDPEVKNRISHRAKALLQLPEILARFSA
jgi:XTP/dITP diphosphohydrolase